MANPKKTIDWAMVDSLCKIQCTAEEIASLLNVCTRTLDNHIKETFKLSTFEYIRQKAAGGKASLRRMQYKSAEGGNAALLIWLGKQHLGQKDKQDLNHVSEDGSMTPQPSITAVDAIEAAKQYQKIMGKDE